MKKLIFSFIVMALAIPSFALATEDNNDNVACIDLAYPVPTVALSNNTDQGITLSWNKIDDSRLAGYKVVISEDNETPVYPADGYLKWITNTDTISQLIDNSSAYRNGDFGSYLNNDEEYYFSITAVYDCGGTRTSIAGNVLKLKFQEGVENDDIMSISDASGNFYSDTTAKIKWKTNTQYDCTVIFSTKDNNLDDDTLVPGRDPDDIIFGSINPSETSSSPFSYMLHIDHNQINSTDNKAYFKIICYDEDSNKKTTPVYSFNRYNDSEDTTVNVTHPAPEVSIDSSENGILLSWKKISDDDFTGYKVVISKSTKNPKYPDHGYARYITNSNTVSYLLDNSSDYVRGDFGGYLKAGADYYFSITALYGNTRVAGNSIETTYNGPDHRTKPDVEPLIHMQDNAKKLLGNELGDILTELQELRSLVREQSTEIKYLHSLMADFSNVAQSVKDTLNQFITYGVDENTKKLGEGERAAVIHSFKSAFGKLPETENEVADAIKIANGRWPSQTNEAAEHRAKVEFKKIYLRDASMDNSNDNAAVTVMAYGLRQKAENRNLNSEREGIKTFKYIYGSTPNSTEDWNIMQAITYSGATR